MTKTVRRLEEVVIFFNRRAGAVARQGAVEALCEGLRQQKVRCEVESDPGELQERVTAWSDVRAAGSCAVIAAGGDGTVGLAISRLPAHIPLGVFPLGTENLLAKYLGCSADPATAAARLATGKLQVWDALQVNGQLAVLMVSCGFDAEVVKRLHARRTGNISHWSYATPFWQTLWEYPYTEIKVEWGGATDEPGVWHDGGTARWCFVFNAPVYALGLPLGATAIPFDGQLDILTLQAGGCWGGLSYFASMMCGQLEAAEGVNRQRATRARLTSDGPVPYQVDGDPGGMLPVVVEVIPQRIQLLA